MLQVCEVDCGGGKIGLEAKRRFFVCDGFGDAIESGEGKSSVVVSCRP